MLDTPRFRCLIVDSFATLNIQVILEEAAFQTTSGAHLFNCGANHAGHSVLQTAGGTRAGSSCVKGERRRPVETKDALRVATDLSVVTDVIGKQTNPSDALGQPSLLDPSF